MSMKPIKPSPHSPQTNSAATPQVIPTVTLPRDIEQGGDHEGHEPHSLIVSAIRHHYRRRVDYHSAEKRLTLQIKAICRRLCDGDKTEAGKLYKAMMGGHPARDTQGLAVSPLIALAACEPLLEARDIVEKHRKTEEKTLAKLAKSLPVWEWVETVRGAGALSLAQIIGETGDLSLHANPDKVKKRLGLAPYNGKAPSTWRMGGGATADEPVAITQFLAV